MIKLILYILIFALMPANTGCSNLPKNDSKKKISIQGKKFIVEIADTMDEQRKGLMNRKTMPADEGMLFLFGNKEYPQFWMKDTFIPLQALMVDGCVVVDLVEMKVENDPANANIIYKSSKSADKAIELNTNTFDQSVIGYKIKELCK